VREYTARVLDGLVGRDSFDMISEVAARIPIRVIGLLLGIPEPDQEAIRGHLAESMEHPDKDRPLRAIDDNDDLFGAYIEWRVEHPSDDLMTKLLNAEFEDETGSTRRLERDELLTLVNVLAGAGVDTTNRLMGWTAKLLGDHPDQRRMVAADPALAPNAIEEILRFEGPSYYFARAVVHDVEIRGETVPAGSIMAVLPASANRDDREFDEPDRFDVHREISRVLTFGLGPHYCLGASLARLEGRVLLEQMLERFPDWHVDDDNASMFTAAFFRGWETLPIVID
jgi:cytochrome P450